MGRLITEDNLGAWLIKSDPQANEDLLRTGLVTKRCVASSYRSRMMKPGDRGVFWISGNGRRVTRGIWGVGWVTGHVQEGHGTSRTGRSSEIALDIPLFGDGEELSSAELVDAGITDLEVQLQPQMSNPSWLSKDQLLRIQSLLGPWPDYVAPEGPVDGGREGTRTPDLSRVRRAL